MARGDARLRALIDELLKVHQPAIRRAFLEAMRDARNSINLQDVIDALVRGDLPAAMEAIEFTRAFLSPLDMAFRDAYFKAGMKFTNLLMSSKPRDLSLEIRFDSGNSRAAVWLTQHSSDMIVDLLDSQRLATREALSAGMLAGQAPRTVALNIVGRVDKVTKQRVGGIVGLYAQQVQWLNNAREELRSGDPKRMRAYLERKLRDRRLDSIVNRAIREGRSVSADDVERIIVRYSDRLLKHRGDTIARTESLTALSYSQDESARQLLEVSGLRPDQIVRTWIARIDRKTRDSHVTLHDDTAPLNGVFISPSTGARMRFPRDAELGAKGEDVINCRCTSSLKVDWKGAKVTNNSHLLVGH